MGFLNPVIELIEDHGHIARHTRDDLPVTCKKCDTAWPCAPVYLARQEMRRKHGVKPIYSPTEGRP